MNEKLVSSKGESLPLKETKKYILCGKKKEKIINKAVSREKDWREFYVDYSPIKQSIYLDLDDFFFFSIYVRAHPLESSIP